jgi:hypothetical protein
MRSAVIVYNPAAGRFSVKPFIKSAVRELESAGWQVDAAETLSGAHTVELAAQAAAEKKDAVFAVGGDGTIGNVVNGLIGTETALGVLPAGTANVWSIELGLRPFAWTHPWVLRQNASLLANATRSLHGCGDVQRFLVHDVGGHRAGCPDHPFDGAAHPPREILCHARIRGQDDLAGCTVERYPPAFVGRWEEVEGQFILAVATNIRHYLGGLSNLSPMPISTTACSICGCSAAAISATPCAMPMICGAAITLHPTRRG